MKITYLFRTRALCNYIGSGEDWYAAARDAGVADTIIYGSRVAVPGDVLMAFGKVYANQSIVLSNTIVIGALNP